MEDSWIEVDWASKWLPDDRQREASISRLGFVAVRVVSEPVRQLVDTFRNLLSNGGAHVATFHVVEADATAAWFMSRNRDEYGLADCLVRSAAFAEALPGVGAARADVVTGFSRSPTLELDGALAVALQWGGAYSASPAISGAEAKSLASAFCTGIFTDRYDDVLVDYSSKAWSPWFKGIAWDGTWVVTDKRNRDMTVVCITDTD